MDMLNKRFIISLFLLNILIAVSCSENKVRSQSNLEKKNSNINMKSLDESKDEVKLKNRSENLYKEGQKESDKGKEFPYTGLIKLKKKLKKKAVTNNDRQKIKKLLRWNDVCDLDSNQYILNQQNSSLWFHPLGNQGYLIEVMCQGGASKIGYLFYYYDEGKTHPTVNLLKFEWYQENKKNGATRIVTYNHVGSALFKDSTKKLKLSYNFIGRGGCGVENTYSFKHGKPILVEMRAYYDCKIPKNPPWQTKSIRRLRKLANKTYDATNWN